MTTTSQYTFNGALATIHDPKFFRTWMEDQAYVDRLVASGQPADRERKLVAVEFQRGLARVVARNRVVEEIDALLERFMSADYGQHDAHLGDGREPLSKFFKGAVQAGVDLWPPMPISVMNDGDQVALLLQAEVKPGVPLRFIPTQFRVSGGLLREHWSAAAPPRDRA
jgi:predicted SnoaL-like aldol condensation-catalyzing enzyme